MTLALLAGVASSAAAAPSPALPGGKYKGSTSGKKERPIKVKVFGSVNESVLRGRVVYRCAGIRASFSSDDGTFVAKQRNRKGRVIFKASGRFQELDTARGKVERLAKQRRKRGCQPRRFSTELQSPAGVEQRTIRYGPFDTEPSGGGHGGGHGGGGGHNVGMGNLEKPCEDCMIVGMVPDLKGGGGASLNYASGAMMHHVVFAESGQRDPTCSGWPQRFFAAGNERSPFVLPRGYGYPVDADHRWSLITHLMNLGEHARNLYIEVTFYYVQGQQGLDEVVPFWLDIDRCGNSEYMTPAGWHTENRAYTVPRELEGGIVAIGGHLHDHGERIKVQNLSRGETVCSAGADYDGDASYAGHISRVGGCAGRPLARISAGEKLSLLARYNAPEPIHDVMGIMLGYVAPGA